MVVAVVGGETQAAMLYVEERDEVNYWGVIKLIHVAFAHYK